jgi:hypothetical protein
MNAYSCSVAGDATSTLGGTGSRWVGSAFECVRIALLFTHVLERLGLDGFFSKHVQGRGPVHKVN